MNETGNATLRVALKPVLFSVEVCVALLLSSAVAWLTVHTFQTLVFPEPSEVARTVSSGAIIVCCVILSILCLVPKLPRIIIWSLGVIAMSIVPAAHFGRLLRDTPHYLVGLGGDQIFRVAYLNRFTTTNSFQDMFFADATAMYPPLWFWVGGKLAVIAEIPAWEFYKLFAILTMSVAGPIAFTIWHRLIGIRSAIFAGLITSVAGAHTNGYEPYSWIVIATTLPVAAWVFFAARHLSTRKLSRLASTYTVTSLLIFVAAGLYLGVAAMTYTLAAGFAAIALTVLTIGAVLLWARSLACVVYTAGALCLTAAISAALASLFWLNYLMKSADGTVPRSVAPDFIPESSAFIPTPIFDDGALGVICLLGLMWITYRSYLFLSSAWAQRGSDTGHDSDPRPLEGVVPVTLLGMVVVAYCWYLASMLRAYEYTSLLPFRTIPLIVTSLCVGAVCACSDWWRSDFFPQRIARATAFSLCVVIMGGTIALAQRPSGESVDFAEAAAGWPKEEPRFVGVFDSVTEGSEPEDVVVLTADYSIAAFRPVFVFQAPVQAYATPLSRYEQRNDTIALFASSTSTEQLVQHMNESPFRAPDVFVLRIEPNGLAFTLAQNILPVRPDNTLETIWFDEALFANPNVFTRQDVDGLAIIKQRT